MEIRLIKAICVLVALTAVVLACPALAAGNCTAAKPHVTWSANSVRWNSYHDFLDRLLSVDMLFSATGAKASTVTVLSSANSENVSISDRFPFLVGDIDAGGSLHSRLTYYVPPGVTDFRTSLYIDARDGCGNDYFFPQPNNTAARFSMSAEDNGYGQIDVNIDWDQAYDSNKDAVATVKYRLYPSNWWDSELPEYTVAGTVSHGSVASRSLTLSGLLPGRYYDFAVEVSDADGVDGPRQQEDSQNLLRDNRFTVASIFDNPHPGNFDEVRVRDFYSNTLFWYSAQSVWEYGNGYEYFSSDGINREFSEIMGKTAWESVVQRSTNRIFIAGELPRWDGGHNYRSMIGVIHEDGNPPWLDFYKVPNTDDSNEFIGLALDDSGDRLLAGERSSGTPLQDSLWPNGGGLWSVPLGTINQPSTYGRVYQDPLNRNWDKLVVYNGRLYAKIAGSLISASLSDIPASGPMSPAAWRTEFATGVFSMLVSPWHGLVVARECGGLYVTLSIFDGMSWTHIDSNKVFTGEGLYELSDHRFVITRQTDYVMHHVQIASVTGEWENLGIYPGSGPSSGFVRDPEGSIYYGTVSPGKVMKIAYAP